VVNPSCSFQVDLDRAASDLGIDVSDLIGGLRGDESSVALSGTISNRGANVNFRLRAADTEPVVALLSCASRPGNLDSREIPKALIQLRGKSVIRHVLLQLLKSGIDKVYVVLGYLGGLIKADISACQDLHALGIEYVDLGSDYSEGYARSLMYAYSHLPSSLEQVLLATADHIFEQSIIESMTRRGAQTLLIRTLFRPVTVKPLTQCSLTLTHSSTRYSTKRLV